MATSYELERFTGGMAQTNGYLLRPVDTEAGVILIDAPAGVARWLEEMGEQPDWLLLTHHHFDHVENAEAVARMGARVVAFAEPSPELTLESLATSWGMPLQVKKFGVHDVLGTDQPTEGWADLPGLPGWRWAHVPGHAADGTVFHFQGADWLFAGDTLFEGSIGRTDLPGGDHQQLIEGIRNLLLPLTEETRVLPGHGEETTIGREAAANPYLGG